MIWLLIIYVTVVNRQITLTDSNEEVSNRLQKLEDGIAEQYKLNRHFINDLHTVIEAKKQAAVVDNEIEVQTRKEFKGTVIPVLVLACNRVSVSRCLDQLIQYRPNPDQFPIIVSQVSMNMFL